MISIDIIGADGLQNKIKDVSKALSSDKLIAKAALIIERQMKINASGRPGPKVRSNRLRSSIATEVKTPHLARVAPNVFYAPFVEFGHRQTPGQFVPPLKRRLVADFAPAYPFVQPTIDQTKDKIQGVCVSFGNSLEGIWNK